MLLDSLDVPDAGDAKVYDAELPGGALRDPLGLPQVARRNDSFPFMVKVDGTTCICKDFFVNGHDKPIYIYIQKLGHLLFRWYKVFLDGFFQMFQVFSLCSPLFSGEMI